MTTPARQLQTLAKTDRRRWAVVGLLFAAVLVNYVDRGNLSIVAVPLMNEFGMSTVSLGTLLSAFFWTYTLLQIPVGFVVDRFGLKWAYAIAFLTWSIASAAVGFASSFGQVLAFRLLLGVGESVAQPASLAYIRQNFSEDQQGLPSAVYLTGMMIGPAAGAFLGAALLETLSWRELFIYTGLGGLVWLIPWLWLAPSGSGRAKPSTTANERSGKRIEWLSLLRNPIFWGITFGAFFYSYFWYFCLTWLPSYLMMTHGLSFLKMGAYTAIPLLGMAIVSMIAGRAADKIISRGRNPLVVRRSFVVTGFAAGSSLLLLLFVHSLTAVFAVLICSLLGLGLASANYWAMTQTISPARVIGRVIGYQNTVANLAGICAPIVTGYLVGEAKDFRMAILFAGSALLLACAAFAFLVTPKGSEDFRLVVGRD
jgi:ACS family D-galactonate transporter-like MFS transporter